MRFDQPYWSELVLSVELGRPYLESRLAGSSSSSSLYYSAERAKAREFSRYTSLTASATTEKLSLYVSIVTQMAELH